MMAQRVYKICKVSSEIRMRRNYPFVKTIVMNASRKRSDFVTGTRHSVLGTLHTARLRVGHRKSRHSERLSIIPNDHGLKNIQSHPCAEIHPSASQTTPHRNGIERETHITVTTPTNANQAHLSIRKNPPDHFPRRIPNPQRLAGVTISANRLGVGHDKENSLNKVERRDGRSVILFSLQVTDL